MQSSSSFISKVRAQSAAIGVVLLLGLIALLVWFSPINVPYSVEARGRVLPVKEWLLVRGLDGRLVSELKNHARGTTENFSVAQFERQDAIRFAIEERILNSDVSTAGDTIGTVHSSQNERVLNEIQGQLEAERATLKLYQAGQKASIVSEARQVLRRAEARVAAQTLVVNRLRELENKNAVAVAQLEVEQGNLRVFELDVDIAKAQLEAVQSGERAELVDLTRSRINALERDMITLRRRLDDYTIVSPLSGAMYHFSTSDTMMVIADTSYYVVSTPVQWTEAGYLDTGDEVVMYDPSSNQRLMGKIIRKENFVRSFQGQAGVVVITAVQPIAGGKTILPGSLVECSIRAEKVRLREWLRRFMRSNIS